MAFDTGRGFCAGALDCLRFSAVSCLFPCLSFACMCVSEVKLRVIVLEILQ